MISVKKNIIFNGLNTVTSILFPMITFPYAARVLLPEGIGIVNFQLSIINYIILLTSLGIPLYAVKEIAKYQNQQYLRDKNTIEIILLSLLLCLFGYIIVILISKFVPQIEQNASLFYILSLSIVFNTIGVNWFYQGIEDFQYITIRAIIIRILVALSLFVFVKDSNDLLIYGLITVGASVGNNFINFIHLRSFIDWNFINLKKLEILKHLKPATHVFILNLIVSLYIQLNTIMLGFMQGDAEVGYFTAGTKITHVGLTLISSIGTVLLPRGTNMLQNNEIKSFASIITKSARITVAISLPMIVGLIILATPVTLIFCGKEYLPSIPILYLNAPVIFFIGLTNVMGIQVLYPKNQVTLVIWSVCGGAITNVAFNLILIPLWGATGAAVATLFAECSVFIIQIILGKKYYPFKWKNVILVRYVISAIIMGIVLIPIKYVTNDYPMQLVTGICLGVISYAGCLYFLKDDIMRESINFILKRR